MDNKTDIKLNYKKTNTNIEKECYTKRNKYILNYITKNKN